MGRRKAKGQKPPDGCKEIGCIVSQFPSQSCRIIVDLCPEPAWTQGTALPDYFPSFQPKGCAAPFEMFFHQLIVPLAAEKQYIYILSHPLCHGSNVVVVCIEHHPAPWQDAFCNQGFYLSQLL